MLKPVIKKKVIREGGLKLERITLTVREVAEMLGISTTTVYTMVREEELPHFKVRGKILFNKEKIIQWTKGELGAGNEPVNI